MFDPFFFFRRTERPDRTGTNKVLFDGMDVTVFAKFHLWLGLTFFYSLGAKKVINLQKNRTQKRTKTPMFFHFFYWVCFWGFVPNNNYVGQDNPQLPLANEHIA